KKQEKYYHCRYCISNILAVKTSKDPVINKPPEERRIFTTTYYGTGASITKDEHSGIGSTAAPANK
uniref:Uncharacterized protein n=1 Tax=Romanomermis culicivorax TaxID=13658 RepID=A0A915IU00_ROMCU